MFFTEQLPPVTPQQKIGWWIYVGYAAYDWWKCSECGKEHVGDVNTLSFYCPNCGSKMEVKENG